MAGKASCDQIVAACHPLDTGSGPAHDCHEAAEAAEATEESCAARKAECLTACPAPIAADASPQTDASPDSGGLQTIAIQFEARVGAEKFDCTKSFANVGTSGSTVEPLTFAFYIHDVRVMRPGGTEVPLALTQDAKWQFQDVALLDFENKTGTCSNGTTDTNTVIKGAFPAPSGLLTGIKFKVGVPASLNHGNVATQPSPLNLSSMFWDWQSGYKFMRMDFRVKATADAGPSGAVLLHLGSTGCSPLDAGTACSKLNVAEVSLTGAFNPATNKIVIDYAKLVKDNDFTSDKGGPPGCMADSSDPECAGIFKALGLDVATGNPGSSAQTAFTIE